MPSSLSTQFEEIREHELAKVMLQRQNQEIYPELFVKFKPKECFLPKDYAAHYDYIKDLSVRDDDVWVVSFIKSGKLKNLCLRG